MSDSEALSQLEQDLKRWGRRRSKTTNVAFEKVEQLGKGSTAFFTVGQQTFSVVVPEGYPSEDPPLIDYNNIRDGFDFLADVNSAIFEQNLTSVYGILRFINSKYRNYLKREKKTKTKKATRLISVDFNQEIDTFFEEDKLLDQYDFEEIRYRRELEAKLSGMKSELALDSSSGGINSVPKLFEGNQPATIVLNQLFSCRSRFKRSRTIEVDISKESVFTWSVKFKDFDKEQLQTDLSKIESKFGYNSIDFEIQFHDKFYPTYPPFIRVIKPRLDKNLMNRMTKLKMVLLEFWSPCRSMEFVIDKLYSILNQHAVIDLNSEMNDPNRFGGYEFQSLEAALIKLASLSDIDDETDDQLDTQEYPRIYNIRLTNTTSKRTGSTSKGPWKAGTGYGREGDSQWNIEEYLELQREKDMQIQAVLKKILQELGSATSESYAAMYDVIKKSYLVQFIKSYLFETTLLEISKHLEIYKLIFGIMNNLATSESIFLFDDEKAKNNLYDTLKEVASEAEQVIRLTKDNGKSVGEDSDIGIAYRIKSLFEMVDPIFSAYMESIKSKLEERRKKQQERLKDNDHESNPLHLEYVQKMKPLRFEMGDYKFAPEGKFRYGESGSRAISTSVDRKMMRRLAKDFTMLSKSLPVRWSSSIFFRVDETNNRLWKVLITGPDGTPYDSGVLIFHLYIPDSYPESPPKMVHVNNGAKRFNPNLYASGKVCLSLLGTWGNNWNKDASTILQLFVSVQSQILIDTPVFNEPSYESYIGTSTGNDYNRKYNIFIQYYNMCYAMIDTIKNIDSYPEFKDVILDHFKMKKEYILEICQKWVDGSFECSSSLQHKGSLNKTVMQTKFDELKKVLDELVPDKVDEKISVEKVDEKISVDKADEKVPVDKVDEKISVDKVLAETD